MATSPPRDPASDSSPGSLNGVDINGHRQMVNDIRSGVQSPILAFKVSTRWTGKARSETVIDHCSLGKKKIERRFKIVADEPIELGGQDSAANPQELLLTAMNSCVLVGFVTNAALKGIRLTHLEIETRGSLDMRGFLGIDEDVKVGCQQLDFTVRVAGDGTPEQFLAIHKAVLKRSPNYFDLSQPISVRGRLEILPN